MRSSLVKRIQRPSGERTGLLPAQTLQGFPPAVLTAQIACSKPDGSLSGFVTQPRLFGSPPRTYTTTNPSAVISRFGISKTSSLAEPVRLTGAQAGPGV